MNRVQKTIYQSDKGYGLLSLRKDGKAELLSTIRDWTPDELCELSTACLAAAEELRSLAERTAVEVAQ